MRVLQTVVTPENQKEIYDSTIHHCRSIRLRGYNYAHPGLYFVTVCVQNKECLFGEIVDGKMMLNRYGQIVQTVWNELPRHYRNIELGEFVIMPNHIHGIITIMSINVGAGFKPAPTMTDTPIIKNHDLSEIVRALKTFSAKRINGMRNVHGKKLWQRNYYEYIIRNEDSHYNIANYIVHNPINWQTDVFYMKSNNLL